MKIAYPVTDYIRASTLTTEGDILRRGVAVPERVARSGAPAYLAGYNAVGYPVWRNFAGTLNQYLKAVTAGFPAYSPLALRDTGIFIGNSMRNSGGAQVISGIGFEASVVIFLAGDTTAANINISIGFDNGTVGMCVGLETDGALQELMTNRSIRISRGAGNQLTGYITAIGADGFTITWTLAGACSVDFAYLCLP